MIIVFILVAIGFVITVEILMRRGKLRRVTTYSYSAAIRRSLLHLVIAVGISLLIYLLSESLEITMTLGLLLLFSVLGGLLYGLLWEHQTKRGGGRKVE
jgi:hypothetical protein